MKPLRLRLQAFGPYPRESVVDFRSLVDGGLFLIHGPTGAGKTSILDGICFSLFGRASGAERAPDALRSDRAPGDLPTEARLEFALGADVYRVTRQPKQELTKKRGEGLKTSRPEGVLEKLARGETDLDAGTWDLVASGDKKTDEAVVGLLGMNEDQFRQVVVLPQGQFRKFLAAGSDEREELLERLFRTHRFRELGESMEGRKRLLEREISERRTKAAALFSSLDVETESDLIAMSETSRARLDEINAGEAEIERRHKEASERLTAARAVAKTLRDLEALEARRIELDRERLEIGAIGKRLKDERRARPVSECDRRVIEIEGDVARLRSEIARATEARARSEAELASAQSLRESLLQRRPEAKAWEREVDEIGFLFPKASRLIKEKADLIAIDAELSKLEASAGETSSRLAKLKESKPELDTRSEAMQEKIGAASELADEHTRLVREIEAARELFKRVADRQKVVSRLADARQAAEKSELHWGETNRTTSRMKLAYHVSQASRIAAELEDGDPCPVCGSTDHPHPAVLPAETPTQTEIDTIEAKLAQANEAKLRARAFADSVSDELTRIDSDIATVLTGTPDAWETQVRENGAALKVRLDAIEAVRSAAKAAQIELVKLKSEREGIDREIAILEKKLEAEAATRDDRRTKNQELQTRVSELEVIVPVDRRDLDALETRGRLLGRKLDGFREAEKLAQAKAERASNEGAAAIERVKTLEEKIAERDANLTSSREALAARLSEAGFATLDEARAAALPDSEVASLEARVREFEAEWARVDGRVQELRTEAASAPPEHKDLASTEVLFAEVDAARTSQRVERLSLADRIRQLETARERSREAGREIERLETRFKVVGRLAEISAGRPPNELRINFQRYVLASRLDDVLEQASRRLHSMSSGIFSLKRARRTDDKRKSAGLDLEVDDAFTGTSRGTASLSGGEGFLASLSLALGLADVVQMHLGGVRLEAVFVDEGFGTLDPEALELAMRVLADLQAGGRLVGIISHVPELRDQIARRLAVRKTVDGSEIAWETGAV
ncbi:MAG: SMC family ATPase [Bdellovibrionota bacterium]